MWYGNTKFAAPHAHTHTHTHLVCVYLSCSSYNDEIYPLISFIQWSFGVTVWETFSGGAVPYAGIRPMTFLKLLTDGETLPIPSNTACSSEM